MTPMEFIGITAGFDAALALVSWFIVRSRRASGQNPPSQVVAYFQSYLIWTTIFLALTAVAMLMLQGATQMITVIISDIALWISLLYFILLAAVGRSTRNRNIAIAVFLIAAIAASLNQVATLMQLGLSFGPLIDFALANMAALLMYAVWIPSALIFFLNAAKTADSFARLRFLIFGAGLILITVSWAWRLPGAMAGLTTAGATSIVTIMAISLAGFIGILMGVLYQPKRTVTQPRPQFAR